MNEEEKQIELDILSENVYNLIEEFISSHPEIDPSEVWEKAETTIVNASK